MCRVMLGSRLLHVDLDLLTLKSVSDAPRSPVNNCGEVGRETEPVLTVTPPEYVTAVMNLIESGDVSWDDPDVAKVLRDAVREQSPKVNRQQRIKNRNKSRNDAPPARLTSAESDRIPKIRLELAQDGITAERWELKALTRGAKVSVNGKEFSYPPIVDWLGFGGKV
ncbi:hypothetical protein FCH33_18305 [Serratia fonticola]|uniref:hypothetical protein n=1 Tax=Serratia fonticola TaxID=47917 RepID=UPI0015766049|nr:hypothetical protein [Serratia fonticola]NTY88729.1 hypothetical protein [Serratia fonticola]NTZ14291.1 hypothetical protein [Serratia fonticola]